MIDPKIIDLMNLVLDGAATPADRANLDRHLAAHPDARSYYDGLEKLVSRLNADPISEPPAGLESRILDTIHHLPVAGPARAKDSSSSWLKGFFAPLLRPLPSFGLGLATGLFLLAVVQYSRSDFWSAAGDIDPSNVSGSMTTRVVEPIATIPVETPEGTVSGSAVIYSRGSDLIMDVKLQSTIAIEWNVAFAPAWSVDRIERHGTATSAFAANRGSVQGLHTGEGSVTIVFNGSPAAADSVVFKVLQGGTTVFEGRPATH
jgi:hypothetical protein